MQSLNGIPNSTARNYVDHLQGLLSKDDHLNKGEKDDESLEEFKDTTIEGKLKDKIFDSSITIVLISKNMWDKTKPEKDQWIPWEVGYSLRNKTRGDKTSQTNGFLAVALPDENGGYSYFIDSHYCSSCTTTLYKTNTLFKVLRVNMFNKKDKQEFCCENGDHKLQRGEFSYIKAVKWSNFIGNIDKFLEIATEIRNNRDEYDVTVNVY